MFREDLYYRLNVLHLHLPPLRERETDIRFLINHFLRFFAERTGNSVKAFSDMALRLLMAYAFPGNIRELRNVVEYCVNICQNQQIEAADLPKYLFAPNRTRHATPNTGAISPCTGIPASSATTDERSRLAERSKKK